MAEGMSEAAELLREADAEVVETGFDNWNGGTCLYTVFFSSTPRAMAGWEQGARYSKSK